MKKKLFFLKGYHNIIILILILAILFFFGKMILDRNTFAQTTSTIEVGEKLELEKNQTQENKFLTHAIHQVFPGAVNERITIKNHIQNFYSSFIHNIFQVDLKNPLTFVQALFSVDIPEDTKLVDNDQEKEEDIPGDPSREIFFVDLEEEDSDHSVETGTVPRDRREESEIEQERNDSAESWEGIYLIEPGDIIDSLNSGDIDGLNVEKPKEIVLEKDKPHILIYHTHGTESYRPASEGNYHTLRKEYSVMEVGRILTEELEKRGYNVIHDTTYHDYPSYSGSYGSALQTVRTILEKNPSIKVVLDIHRDGYDNIETSPNRESLVSSNRANINNKASTKFQFVIGPESANRKEVEVFANYVKTISDSKYPGFSKPILVKPYGTFNQYLSDHSALIEVGSNANAIEEARRTALYLADVLADALDHIKK